MERIINDPKSIAEYTVEEFETIGKQSSWECKPAKNGKGIRVYKDNKAIRYNLNGTRFDDAHFNGRPYWVVSDGTPNAAPIKVLMK
ncbi:MAG: hypothetical protein J6Q72_02680 [Clostridia bacterium]|nr:hypothetical protein [Clostridia bacterium]